MKENAQAVKETIRTFVFTELLKNKNVNGLNDASPLITGGLMDSISTMQLVVFLEKTFHMEFEAHEVDRDNFDSIDIITDFLMKKL
ncbi:MAG: acyl carrier protein [Bacteroidota bacterium]|jgi:acyl carrier protein|nr:acyl carrier protein [Bacteroidota bacterium]